MAGKNSAAGRLGLVKWGEGDQPLHWSLNLPIVLEREKNYYKKHTAVGQPEIDNAVCTWFKVYHSLVWLSAATNQKCHAVYLPFTGTVTCDGCPENPFTSGELHCLKESHLVPAFSAKESGCEHGDIHCQEIIYNSLTHIETGDAEVDNEVRKGWIFEDLRSMFNDRHLEDTLKRLGEEFAWRIYQGSGSTPLLQLFLNKFRQLSSDFDAATCLDSCLRSRSEMGFGQDAKENIYVDKALNLIQDLWAQQQLENHLGEMKQWVAADASAGSQEWLETQLGLDSIADKISALFSSNNLEAKKKVSRWTAVLEINTTTFNCIYKRLGLESDDSMLGFEVGQGLEAAVKNLAISSSTQRVWNDLSYATYGAVAWQIFRQANLAAGHVLQTLNEVGLHG